MRKQRATSQLHVNKTRCPCCGKRFVNILRHLNHQQSKCADWFDTISSLHTPSPPYDKDSHDLEDPIPQDHSPECSGGPAIPSSQQSLYRIEFPGTGATYGHTGSFMDRFNSDKYSSLRTENMYYPFAGKAEWELRSFLHSSGLSMRKIDEFLKLKMVITNFLGRSELLIMTSRSGMLAYPFPQQRRSAVGWKCSLRFLIGSQRRLPSWVIRQVNQCTSSIATLSIALSTYLGIRYLPITWTSVLFTCIKMQNRPSACTASG